MLLSWERPEAEGGEALSGFSVELQACGAASDGAWHAVCASEVSQVAFSSLWDMWVGACGQSAAAASVLTHPPASALPLCCALDFGSFDPHDVRIAALNSAGAGPFVTARVWPMPSRPAPPTALEFGPTASGRAALRCALRCVHPPM